MAEAMENRMFAGEEQISGDDLGEPSAPATTRARSEVAKPSRSKVVAKPKTGGSDIRRGGPKRASGGSNTPKRPRNAKAGAGARLLAPLAIIVFALAGFVVLNGGDSDSTTPTEERTSTSEQSTESSSGGETTTSTTTRSTYRVKEGDNFDSIAQKFNIDVAVLSELNKDVDPLALQPGQKLKLK